MELKNNPIENILEVELKEFVNNLKKDLKNGHRKLAMNNAANQFTS